LQEEILHKEKDLQLIKQTNDLMKKTKEKELERYMQEISSLETTLDKMESSHNSNKNEITLSILDSEILKLTQEKQSLEASSQLRVSELQQEISLLQKDLSEKDSSLLQTERAIAQLKAQSEIQLQELENQFTLLQETSLTLSSSLEALQNSIKALPPFSPAPDLPQNPPEIESLMKELNEYELILVSLEKSRRAGEEEMENLSRKIAEEKKKEEDCKKKEEEGKKTIQKLEKELEEMRRGIDENQRVLKKMEEEMVAIEKELLEVKEVNERMAEETKKNGESIGEMGKKGLILEEKKKEMEIEIQKKKK
jgi:chromosome segregation ATPase